MPEDSIHQPHDKLFKQGFSDPANAAGFLRHQFPASLSGQIDWDHLTLQSGSFVDSHFRQHESDLLFAARLRDSDCLLYLLFEHQLAEDPLIALRLLRYMVRIWENFLKEKPGAALPVILPVILPVVLAQNEKPWKVTPQFSSLIDLPGGLADDCLAYIPEFHFRLVELAGMPYEAIPGTPAGILLLRVMKAERCDDLLGDAVWDGAILEQIPGVVFEMMIRYLLGADVDSVIFERKLNEISQSNLKDSAMTLAQQLTQKGLEKGLHEGRQEGLREAILETLAVRFGDVPQNVAGMVRRVDDEIRLRSLHHASIQSPTMDDFFLRL